ncbi:MAG TPA: type VII secretion protein EccB [Jatrophihabitans sp.]|nr:type VII secretion protein EccB [Jatrophihabitans sp.]
MQTRRDQLQAYRFQNRRALASLVTGEPNVVEPPMRRLTVLTMSGIMIAILIAVGFALVGVFKPAPGDSWKDPGTVIIEEETGARYVILDGALHPVVNFTSAVLAAANKQNPNVVTVSRSDLRHTKRGATIGIARLPDSLPNASNLDGYPWTVCSTQQANGSESPQAKVSLDIGSTGSATALGNHAVVVADTKPPRTQYLLVGGTRYAIASPAVETALNLTGRPVLEVGTSFLQALPAGSDLRTPTLPDVGAKSHQVQISGQPATIGQIVHTTDTDQYFIVLDDGVEPITNPLWLQLLRSLRGAAGTPVPEVRATFAEVSAQPQSPASWGRLRQQLADLPGELPAFSDDAAQHHGVCAIYRSAGGVPALALPPTANLPSFHAPGVTESAEAAQGQADVVAVSPGRAAVVTAGNAHATVFLVAAPGKRFPFPSRDTLGLLGYGEVSPLKIPPRLLMLIPQGPALDTAAARTPTSG